MKLQFSRTSLLLSLLVLCSPATSRAANIDVSSLTTTVNFWGDVTTTTWYANAFKSMNYSGLGLVDQVYLRLASNDLSKAANLMVRVYNDNTGQVGQTLLDSFVFQSQPVLRDGVQTALFKSTNSGLQAAPNTKYWLVVGGMPNLVGNASWLGRYTNSEIIGLNAKILPDTETGCNIVITNNGGQSWQGCWVPNPNCKMFEFALSAPEPSTYVFGPIVTALLALTARNPRLRALHRRNLPKTATDLPPSLPPATAHESQSGLL
ncbi:MAG: choice-of-anchor R domain-containing protein [Isosphaeraceae bacterium]